MNYSCPEAKYSIRSEEKVQTIIPELWIVPKPVSAQFDAVSPQEPRLASDQCGIHLLAAGPPKPIVLGGNYTDYHYTTGPGIPGGTPDKLSQTQSLDLHIGSSFGCDRSNNSIYIFH